MNENQGFSPIVFSDVDPRIAALGNKSSEEKIYLILYEYMDNEIGDLEQKFKLCVGREDCYRTIENILATIENVDINKSVVLVEVPGINKNGKGEWLMKNPINAPSIYQFCKMVEKMFGETAFDVDAYLNESSEEESNPVEDFKAVVSGQAVRSEADIFEGDQNMANVYNEAMKNK